MSNEQFIKEIISYYNANRSYSLDPKGYHIWRGVNHSISSKTEDLFARFVAKRLDRKDLEFIVDKTMSYKYNGMARSKQFRPDLAIVKDGQIKVIVDLKMDMGYKRNFQETDSFKSDQKRFSAFHKRPNGLEVWYKDDKDKKVDLTVSQKAINLVVAISSENIGATKRSTMKKAIAGKSWVNLYFLTQGEHPNGLNGKDAKGITDESEFTRLFSEIENQLKK